MHIMPIVEGHGEVDAVPVLIRRIAAELGIMDLRVGRPIRCGRQRIVQEHKLTRVLELAARKVEWPGSILILLDAHSECPAELGPSLLRKAREQRRDLPIGVILAKQEYEAWFFAALSSLKDQGRIPGEAERPIDAEAIQGAKEHLRGLMGRYAETVDQPALTALFDMTEARGRSPSFDKCWREVERLLLEGRGA